MALSGFVFWGDGAQVQSEKRNSRSLIGVGIYRTQKDFFAPAIAHKNDKMAYFLNNNCLFGIVLKAFTRWCTICVYKRVCE